MLLGKLWKLILFLKKSVMAVNHFRKNINQIDSFNHTLK